ncbi:hypothetical protein QBC35DRAFT_478162 [Podospora australis]|uniref:Uncharacterized protein n=1 Tax=Podospora australis TaxID=1536484 RepID=A0AAN7AEZ2_9PEZI|nr:hypothetical protein QBC35DRAFT_478162 [Podospora australis]
MYRKDALKQSSFLLGTPPPDSPGEVDCSALPPQKYSMLRAPLHPYQPPPDIEIPSIRPARSRNPIHASANQVHGYLDYMLASAPYKPRPLAYQGNYSLQWAILSRSSTTLSRAIVAATKLGAVQLLVSRGNPAGKLLYPQDIQKAAHNTRDEYVLSINPRRTASSLFEAPPIILCAAVGWLKDCKELIEAGADPNILFLFRSPHEDSHMREVDRARPAGRLFYTSALAEALQAERGDVVSFLLDLKDVRAQCCATEFPPADDSVWPCRNDKSPVGSS